MTLIEILIVIAIIGLMVGLAVGAINTFSDVDLEKVSSELSSTMRYLYGEAARRNEIYRLAIELDEERYWVESAPNTPETLSVVAAEGVKSEGGVKEGLKENDMAAAEKEAETSASSSDKEAPPPPQGFAQISDPSLNPRAIAPVLFKDVFVSHNDTKVDQGMVYIYFFPNGSTEYAIINISDQDEKTLYSVEMNPLTGKTKIRNEYYENPY